MSNPTIKDAKSLAIKYDKNGIIIFHMRPDGQFGYTSYGTDRVLCQATRKLADVAFEAIKKVFEES